jgi:hypothetical protein
MCSVSHHLTVVLAVGSLEMFFFQVKKVPSNFLRVFIMLWLDFIKCFFCTNEHYCVTFLSLVCRCGGFSDWHLNVEAVLHTSDKSHLIIMHCWIQFSDNLLIIFASIVLRDFLIGWLIKCNWQVKTGFIYHVQHDVLK